MKEYKSRIADQLLADKLEAMGAVLIEGAKACGKTTTAKQQAGSVLRMDDPMNKKQNIQMVTTHISALLDGATPRLIDEWQIAPKLWDAIRYEIDERDEDGQFILTGSAVPPDRDTMNEDERIEHSGAGRFAWLKMRPMSLWESGESSGEVSLEALFNGQNYICGTNKLTMDNLAFVICRGGWPKSLSKRSNKAALQQAKEYYEAIVKSDISRVDGVSRDEYRARRLLRSYARFQGGQVPMSSIVEDLKTNEPDSMSADTVSSYIKALERIFVVDNMPAWNPNLRSKTAIRTGDTRYFVDPSIAVAALGVGPKDLLNDLNTFGLLFETMAARDLRVYADALDGDVFHYRDKGGLECDAVLHRKNGQYGIIEVKLGGDEWIESGAKNLLELASQIDSTKMQNPSFLMVLTGVGQYAYIRKDGVCVVPIGCLRP